MPSKIIAQLPETPGLGSPVPNVEHAISVQLPTWDDICEMFTGAPRVKNAQQTGYPRSFIHKDVGRLNNIVLECVARPNDAVYLFQDRKHAAECVTFAVSTAVHGEKASPHTAFAIRSFELEVEIDGRRVTTILHGVFADQNQCDWLKIYWRTWGTGISSRFAEDYWTGFISIKEVTSLLRGWMGPRSYTILCERIAGLVGRSTTRVPAITKDDVYLYSTGMSAIAHANALLANPLKGGAADTAVFGFPYELTPKFLSFYARAIKFYPFGTAEEMQDLEKYMATQQENKEQVQAVWCECPSNPLLRTPDLHALKDICHKYGVPLIVDETIGSFANVDLLGVADVLVSSLTKTFSGYANVMGGSIVLSPSSPHYQGLRCLLDASYENRVHARDLAKLESNSRDYLQRTDQMNRTASYLVSELQDMAENGTDIITNLYYPEICWSSMNYKAVMHAPSHDFEPGHGCLFTMSFVDVETAKDFFNNLRGVFKGPSLGANVTLVQPYVQTVFHKEKEFAASCGLHESIIRVSVGLEDKHALLQAFVNALAIASAGKAARTKKR